MLTINIPGERTIQAKYLVFDYNGTLAIDGKLIAGVKELLSILGKQLEIHIITADTFGKVKVELKHINCTIQILNPNFQDKQKANYIEMLGSENVIAIGNGQNDLLMIQNAALGIGIMQQEGMFAKVFLYSDIVCTSIIDALNLLLQPLRLIATLRK